MRSVKPVNSKSQRYIIISAHCVSYHKKHKQHSVVIIQILQSLSALGDNSKVASLKALDEMSESSC